MDYYNQEDMENHYNLQSPNTADPLQESSNSLFAYIDSKDHAAMFPVPSAEEEYLYVLRERGMSSSTSTNTSSHLARSV